MMMMISDDPHSRRLRSVATTSAVAVAVALGGAAAGAATLEVHVTGLTGAPLVDAVAILEPTGAKAAVKPMADVEISQTRRQFGPRVTVITIGTRATFPNFDTVRHHVYSFSPIKPFEIKLYAGVPGLPVTFDKPGVGVLGCNIHDRMAAWVVVVDSPWSARSGATGSARIESVPPGSYRLRLWHPGMAPNTEPAPTALTVGAADIEQHVRLNVGAEP